MKNYNLFLAADKNANSDGTLTIFTLNVQSSVKHLNNIVHFYRCLKNGFIRFKETQMKSSDSTSIISDILKYFNMDFNNNDDKFLGLAYGCQNGIVIIRKFKISGIFIINLRKDNFTDKVFT